MDKAEFRDWLGSDFATRQLAAALEEDREICTGCDKLMAADGSDQGFYYGFEMGPLCRTCYREMIVND